MKIDCIADLHGYEPDLPGGELLIIAGDCTASDKITQWAKFFSWVKKQPYEKKILIAGNHDNFLESVFPTTPKEITQVKELQAFLQEQREIDNPDFEYLCDSGIEYEGLKIWGTPWTPWFHGVNPKCKAFMKSESYLHKKFKQIPEELDILVSHGPPHGILDSVLRQEAYQSTGSQSLSDRIKISKPKTVVFGHIHEGHGVYIDPNTKIKYINCSYVNEKYKPVNSAVRINEEDFHGSSGKRN